MCAFCDVMIDYYLFEGSIGHCSPLGSLRLHKNIHLHKNYHNIYTTIISNKLLIMYLVIGGLLILILKKKRIFISIEVDIIDYHNTMHIQSDNNV